MKLNEHHFKLTTRLPLRFYSLGDIHYGVSNCDEDALSINVEEIRADPLAWWIGLGDYTECISLQDKRFNPRIIHPRYPVASLSDLATRQIEDCSDILKPIAHKCIGLGMGNHEAKLLQDHNTDAMAIMCGRLKVKNLDWTCMHRLSFHRGRSSKVLVMVTEHGCQAGRQQGGKLNALVKRLNDWDNIDILLWGHSHEKIATTKTKLVMTKYGELDYKPNKVVAGICPSFYRTYVRDSVGYSEMKQYSPNSLGSLVIEITPFQHNRPKGKHGVSSDTCDIRIIQ